MLALAAEAAMTGDFGYNRADADAWRRAAGTATAG
jgi:hypothetical protein